MIKILTIIVRTLFIISSSLCLVLFHLEVQKWNEKCKLFCTVSAKGGWLRDRAKLCHAVIAGTKDIFCSSDNRPMIVYKIPKKPKQQKFFSCLLPTKLNSYIPQGGYAHFKNRA